MEARISCCDLETFHKRTSSIIPLNKYWLSEKDPSVSTVEDSGGKEPVEVPTKTPFI